MSEPSGGIPNDLRYPVVPVCHCKQPDGPKDLKILATVTKCVACQAKFRLPDTSLSLQRYCVAWKKIILLNYGIQLSNDFKFELTVMSQILPVVVSEPPMKMSTDKHSPSVTSRMTKSEMKVLLLLKGRTVKRCSKCIYFHYYAAQSLVRI